MLIALLLLAAPAVAHDRGFTAGENAWLDRQRAVDGTKCCDEHDVAVGVGVRWRMAQGRYEVEIAGAWVPVPPGRLLRPDPADPSPFGGAALLFRTGSSLWCFQPEPLT